MWSNWDTLQRHLLTFKETNQLTDEFKTFLINHARFEKDNKKWGLLLLNTATELENSYGQAIANLFLSWLEGDQGNTEDMLKYTKIAANHFHQCDSGQSKLGALSILNNEIQYSRMVGELTLAYEKCQKGIEQALKLNEIDYYLIFLTNFAYVLSEIGLVEKAINQLSETIHYEDRIDMSNLLDTYFVLCVLYLRNHDYQKVNTFIQLGLEKSIDEYALFRVCFINMQAELAIAEDDLDMASQFLQQCDDLLATDQGQYIYAQYLELTKARYLMKMQQFDQAKTYYERSIHYFESDFRGKSEIYKEYAECLQATGNKEKAYDYLKIVMETQNSMLNTMEIIYDHKNTDLLEDFRNKTYESLYSKLQQVTKFGKSVFSSFDPDDILIQTKYFLKELFQPDYSCILLLDSKTNCYAPIYLDSLTDFDIKGEINLDDQESMVVRAIIDQTENYNACVEEQLIEKEPYFPKEIRCRMIKPILHQNIVAMVICMGSVEKGKHSKLELSLLEVIGDYVSIAIENAIEYNQTLSRIDLDSLTGIHNRSGIMKVGKAYIESEDIDQIAVLMIDVDNFKLINDSFGHLVGDEVLRKFGVIMKSMMNDDIQCGRYGGEEFLFFVKNTSQMKIERFASNLCDLIANYSFLNEHQVSVSIGGSMFKRGSNLLQNIKLADEQCYLAKNQGKNQICFVI